MTYLRLTRDARGYETTCLLHSARPGDPPRVLYWYRTAPGIRVGRPAFDEDAIRTIEEQHPHVDFDWHHLLEEAATVSPEVERRPERPRRRAPRAKDTESMPPPATTLEAVETAPAAADPIGVTPGPEQVARLTAVSPVAPVPSAPANPLLTQLVGREIAARLRARYAEVSARLHALPADELRASWLARADALDPDRWASPEQILHGVEHADRLFDELKRELPHPDPAGPPASP